MIHTISIWLLVAGFSAAGVVNMIGSAKTRGDFARWGYPKWWGRLTGALELLIAALIGLPVHHIAGLALAAGVMLAVVLTILWHRDFAHLAPTAVFVVLIALAAIPA